MPRGSIDVHAALHHGRRCGNRRFPLLGSVSTVQTGVTRISESTGQYLYLVKVGSSALPVPLTFTLGSFQIDPITPALVPVNSQTLALNGSWVQSAADPHDMACLFW
jgi:hypothetical protein